MRCVNLQGTADDIHGFNLGLSAVKKNGSLAL